METGNKPRRRVGSTTLGLALVLAGVAMLVFEVEALYNHVKSFFVKEGME